MCINYQAIKVVSSSKSTKCVIFFRTNIVIILFCYVYTKINNYTYIRKSARLL